jgi:hypothetical protein
VLLVTVLCSDRECVVEREIVVDDLDGVDAHVCDCGHGFVIVSVSKVAQAPPSGSVIPLRERRRAHSRRAA